jgi:hypothetical protein
MWNIPLAADFLEIFAIPDGEGCLTVRLIRGSGYEIEVVTSLLETVCLELEDSSQS